MSVDTLFDYLESAEGSEDLDALVAGTFSPREFREFCEQRAVMGFRRKLLWAIFCLGRRQRLAATGKHRDESRKQDELKDAR